MGAAGAASGADLVSVGNSALYVSGNDEYLSRTPSSGGSQTTWTFSVWTNGSAYFTAYNGSGTPLGASMVYFNNRQLSIGNYNNSSGWTILKEYAPYWRDPSGWYNLVAVYDSTNAIEEERIRIFVNGVKYTTTAGTVHQPTSSETMSINDTVAHNVGKWINRSGFSNDGYTAETVFLDGTAVIDASSFGQFDSTGLYWTPKSSTEIKALTFGTNGFYLDNTTNAQTDASGEGNNWTNNNTVTLSTHTPTNLYPVLDVNAKWNSGSSTVTYSEGNRKVTLSSANGTTTGIPTFGVPGSGKWVFETTFNTIIESAAMGIIPVSKLKSTPALSGDAYGWNGMEMFLKGNSGRIYDNGSIVVTETDPDISDGATITCEVDLDTPTIKWYNGSSLLGTYEASDGLSIDEDYYLFQATCNDSGAIWTTNWGQDSFNRTVTSGFKAPSTTNIASATTRTASDTNKYFQTVLYEGNGVGQRVGDFQPFTDTFTVAKSALFNSANSESLTRTPSGAGNRRTWTFSTWIKFAPTTASFTIFNGYGSASDTGTLDIFWSSSKIYLRGWSTNYMISDMTFEDESQWGHLVMTLDTTQSTDTNRVKGYWNGVELTWGTASYPAEDAELGINQAVLHSIGAFNNASGFLGAYLAETVFVDGTALTASSFGQTDTSTNRWIPKAVSGLSLGTNGFYLDYSDSSDLGEDQTGSNDFTNNNTVTQTGDSPTINWATLDSNRAGSGISLSNGNRTLDDKSAAWRVVFGTIPMRSGKWYWECHITSSASDGIIYGVTNPNTSTANSSSTNNNAYGYSSYGTIYGETTSKNADWTTTTFTNGDKIGVAVDMDNGYVYFAKNNTWLMSSDPTATTGTGSAFTIADEPILYPYINQYDSFTTNMQFDSSLWSYSAPTGYSALSQDNMTDTEQFISAFSWIKNRDATDSHMWLDRVRGVTKDIHSNTTAAEVTNVETVQRFLAAGVQVGNDVEVNTANESYALWNFMMEATGSGSSNEDGSVNTTRTLVDTTLGLSINLVPVPASGDFTIGHGLGAIPKLIIVKGLETTDNWVIHARATMSDTTDYILFTNAAQVDSGVNVFGASLPTSSVIGLTAGSTAAASKDAIVYAFADTQFISIGSYEGNGGTDGQNVYTVNSLGIPIQPRWIIIKNIDATANWTLFDRKSNPYNVASKYFYPDTNAVEQSADALDLITGGFKWRNSNVLVNAANTYIYMAIGTPMIDTDGRIITGG